MEKRDQIYLRVTGDSLDSREIRQETVRTLRRHNLTVKEVVELVIYIGIGELKEFESRFDYSPGLAEGSLRALLTDEAEESPAMTIRTMDYEESDLLTSMVAFNDLSAIVEENGLKKIVGLGPKRQQFLEHFVEYVHGKDDYSDLRDPMPGPRMD